MRNPAVDPEYSPFIDSSQGVQVVPKQTSQLMNIIHVAMLDVESIGF